MAHDGNQSDQYEDRYERNRRSYLRMMAAGSVVAASAGCLGGGGGQEGPSDVEVTGDTASKRAMNAASQLAEDADKKEISVMFSSGASGNFETVKSSWEDETGTTIKLNPIADVSVSKKTYNAMSTESSAYDVVMIPPKNIPDLTEGGMAKDLTPLVEKYQPQITGEQGVAEPLYKQNKYKGKTRVLMSDGDVMHLHIRSKWLENDQYRSDYEGQYGQELRPPKTVEELDQQIKFFGEMDDKQGAFFYMGPYWLKWTFRRRFIKHGKLMFDDDFHPQFNSDTGVKVIEQLKALKPYMTSNVTSAAVSGHYSRYAKGDVYATYGWPSLSKFLNNPDTSKIADPDEWMIAKAPGTEVDGELFRPEQFTWGWGFMVSNYSKIPELAYLYAQWMYSPSMTTKHIPATGGYLDPFRKNHFDQKKLLTLFKSGDAWQDYRDVYTWNIKHTYPELNVQGVTEYYEAIDTAVNNALNNNKDPQAELDKAAKKCEDITEKYGRDSQIEQWNQLKQAYGQPLRDTLGI